jgi:predicted RNA-binding Zn-ribbon protein involved in translation (DUF1610 family)
MARAADPYLVAWANLRKRRVAFLLVGGLSSVGMLGVVLRWSALGVRGWPAFAAMCAATAAVSVLIRQFRCPRCGERFVVMQGRPRLFTTRCRWCNLPMWTARGSTIRP